MIDTARSSHLGSVRNDTNHPVSEISVAWTEVSTGARNVCAWYLLACLCSLGFLLSDKTSYRSPIPSQLTSDPFPNDYVDSNSFTAGTYLKAEMTGEC